MADFLGTVWWSVLCGAAGFAFGVWSCRTWLDRFFDN